MVGFKNNLYSFDSRHARPFVLNSILRDVLGMAETLDRYLEVAVEAAKKAGNIILDHFHQNKTVENKGKVDLVTGTDKSCEEVIFLMLRTSFPTHKLIGEETAAQDGCIVHITEEPTWIVDPLDGTTNFVHCFPFACVSIGLTIEKVPVVGVVFNPILNEMFTAIKGGGAFLNGQRIHVSVEQDISKALLATEIGVDREEETIDATARTITALLLKVRSIRMVGSCAMNLCGVALGRLDLFYQIGFGGPWDVAAGVVIVEESGGRVFDPSGSNIDLLSHRIACSNAHLKGSFVEALAGKA